MIRKLLIISCLFACSATYAQDELYPMYLPSSTPKSIPDNIDKNVNYTKMGADLPEFRVVTLPQGKVKGNVRHVTVNAKNITNADVKNNANFILMLFNPTCGHCEDQTDTLEKYIYLFKKSKFVMTCAPSMGTYLQDFESNHHTNQYPTIQIGLDSNNLIRKLFLYTALPQINIYDKNRKLIKTFTGGAPIDSLKGYIQ